MVLELYAPTDRSFAMRIQQGFAIGQTPQTIPLYVPLTYALDETTIRCTTPYDDGSDTRPRDSRATATSTRSAVSPDQLLVGISGNASSERLLQGQFRQTNITPGFCRSRICPRTPVGYEMLDLLVLNQPNFNRLDVDQQRAIAAMGSRRREAGASSPAPIPFPTPARCWRSCRSSIGATTTVRSSDEALA